MPRRIPFSHKKKAAQLKDARAVKRGELDASDRAVLVDRARIKARSAKPSKSGPENRGSGQKLHSRFIGFSPDYLEQTRNLAFSETLPRPLEEESACFPMELLVDRDEERKLSCPSRPKFRYGQSKKEVERNEEGIFKKWLKSTTDIIEAWIDGEDLVEEEEVDEDDDQARNQEVAAVKWPRGPSWFETNLEVWRQLWRVTEASHVLLLLLDSRCPPLHCPPSLRTHLQSLKPRKEVILVLTKSDLVDPTALKGWKEWVKGWWGEEVQVVSVMSYDLQMLNDGKGRHKPDIPQQSLDELVAALKTAHERLLIPPKWAQENEKADDWQPPMRRTIDWNALDDDDTHVGGQISHHQPIGHEDDDIETAGDDSRPTRDTQSEPLTIGLIGQPNVGKSSLLNALLGEQKVRASKTPGKTKHFQTMFWGGKKEIKIVDCPGLVCPSLVGLEVQALAGIVPISQIPSLPACIHFAALHLPLETIFRVPPPIVEEPTYVGKKTYRTVEAAERAAKEEEENKKVKWTAGGIIDGRALDRGYLTAKSGRPDTNRAANWMMRALADGKIRWGFFPPGTKGREGLGIWLGSDSTDTDSQSELVEEGEFDHDLYTYDSDEQGEEISDFHEELGETEEEEEEDEEEEEEGEGGKVKVASTGGFFAALELSDGSEDKDEEEDEDEEENEDEEESDGNR